MPTCTPNRKDEKLILEGDSYLLTPLQRADQFVGGQPIYTFRTQASPIKGRNARCESETAGLSYG